MWAALSAWMPAGFWASDSCSIWDHSLLRSKESFTVNAGWWFIYLHSATGAEVSAYMGADE